MKTTRESGEVKSIPYFKRAIELDPNFALGLRQARSRCISVLESRASLLKTFRKHTNSRNASVIPRNSISLRLYYIAVSGDLEKANQTCELWARAYPRDEIPHLTHGLNYEYLGRYEQAISEDLEAIQLESRCMRSLTQI